MTRLNLQIFKAENGSLCSAKVSQIAALNNSNMFIETGTYLGDTTYAMRNTFGCVYSIELSKELYSQAVIRFAGDDNVKLLLGSSSEKLEEVSRIAADLRPIFWLDAHWSAGNTSRGADNTPIKQELTIIARHNPCDAIIMIDDVRSFAEIQPGFDVHESNFGYPLLSELMDYVLQIMPSHTPLCIGDILFIIPNHIYSRLEISNVLEATNSLRSRISEDDHTVKLESIISSAKEQEREVLMMLPEIFKPSLKYGIGGDYLYWRGLLFENDKLFDQAQDDFILARKCGISVPTRDWE